MTLARVTSLARSIATHPVTFLLAINIVCAVIGLAQFAYAITVLEPTDFAVIGVLAAIGGVVTGLFDVKLSDLTSRHFFATSKEDPSHRAGLLTASLALHCAAGLATGLLALIASKLSASLFLDATPADWWLAAVALRMAVAYPVNALTSFPRLLGAFQPSGWLRLATQSLSALITICALVLQPSLAGYFTGMACAAIVTLAITLLATAHIVRTKLGQALIGLPRQTAFAQFLASGRFLAGASLLGWSKLLSRSGDTLLVAAFTSDAVAGLYRVARQAYDNLSGLTDAVHQFYTPTIVEAASRGRFSDVARHRARLMVLGVAVAGSTILLSWLVLRPIAAARAPAYLSALPAFEAMASLLVMTLGVHGWLWPLLVARGGVARFGAWGLAGGVAQLFAIAGLAWAGALDATTAALTGWVMAVVGYVPLLGRTRVGGQKT